MYLSISLEQISGLTLYLCSSVEWPPSPPRFSLKATLHHFCPTVTDFHNRNSDAISPWETGDREIASGVPLAQRDGLAIFCACWLWPCFLLAMVLLVTHSLMAVSGLTSYECLHGVDSLDYLAVREKCVGS